MGGHLREKVARVTGLEPATSGVTGRHSNQLSYTRISLRPLSPEGPASGGALDSSRGCPVSSAICTVFSKISHSGVIVDIDLQVQNEWRVFHRQER